MTHVQVKFELEANEWGDLVDMKTKEEQSPLLTAVLANAEARRQEKIFLIKEDKLNLCPPCTI